MIILNEADTGTCLEEYVLIIPSVSVGNVGQLAVDLLIETLQLKKIGYIRHKNILPVIGYAGGEENIATECEIFASKMLMIAVLQIRSSYGPFNSIATFMSALCKSVKCVVILTGSFAYERKNIHKVDEPIRFLKTEPFDACHLAVIPNTWKILDVPTISNTRVRIPGSGIADHLYHQCKEEGIAAVLLVMFVSEGDNRHDAAVMVTYLDSWLHLRKDLSINGGWKTPLAWDSLFGNPFPSDIF